MIHFFPMDMLARRRFLCLRQVVFDFRPAGLNLGGSAVKPPDVSLDVDDALTTLGTVRWSLEVDLVPMSLQTSGP